jgi:hypothetical protein
VDKCTELFSVHISRSGIINYDNVMVNHGSLLDDWCQILFIGPPFTYVCQALSYVNN